jgi:hypothetical protein
VGARPVAAPAGWRDAMWGRGLAPPRVPADGPQVQRLVERQHSTLTGGCRGRILQLHAAQGPWAGLATVLASVLASVLAIALASLLASVLATALTSVLASILAPVVPAAGFTACASQAGAPAAE